MPSLWETLPSTGGGGGGANVNDPFVVNGAAADLPNAQQLSNVLGQGTHAARPAAAAGNAYWYYFETDTQTWFQSTGAAWVALVPDIDASNVTSGTLNIARIPTGTDNTHVPLGGTIAAGGPIGDSTHVPAITYNAAGQLTTVSSVAIAGAGLPDPVTIAHGGTGQTTQQAALNALAPGSILGQFPIFDGSNMSLKNLRGVGDPGRSVTSGTSAYLASTNAANVKAPTAVGDLWIVMASGSYTNNTGGALSPAIGIQGYGNVMITFPSQSASANAHYWTLYGMVQQTAIGAGSSATQEISFTVWMGGAAASVGVAITAANSFNMYGATSGDSTTDSTILPIGTTGTNATYVCNNFILVRIPNL